MEYLTCGTVGYIVSFQRLKNLKFKFYLVMLMATIVLTIMMIMIFFWNGGTKIGVMLLTVADQQHTILVQTLLNEIVQKSKYNTVRCFHIMTFV